MNLFVRSNSLWQYGRVHIVIKIGDFNIGKFSEKAPIANINSLPINRLVQYYKHVMFLSDIELVQILKLMNTNINLFLVIYPFFITLYLLLHLSNVSHRRRVREREYSYSPSPDRKRGSKRPKREKKHKRRSPSASPSLSPPPKRSNHY